jgi:PhnB protein
MATINPYVAFQGNCEEAFNFYKSVFGGEFAMISKFKDMPEDPNMPVLERDKEKVLHVGLFIGKDLPAGRQGNQLMGSDMLESMGTLQVGNNVSISLGGKVTMPLQDQFWNAYFGMFTDKFGINWMVNYDYNEQK